MTPRLHARVCSFDLDSRGFVRATIAPSARFELGDAKECVEAMFQVGGGRRSRVLVDLRKILSQSREARAYLEGEEVAARTAALALFVESPVSRMIGNFFIGRTALRVPTRLFTDEDAAVRWLTEVDLGEAR